MNRVLAVRLDSDGDVLLTGPAIRALGRLGRPVDVLASPAGSAAARLLPGVDEVLEFAAPWSGFAPPEVDPVATHRLIATLAERDYTTAVIFTSFHQSPLPMALLARLAGIGHVAATSTDYPGTLVDVRHRRADPPEGGHEVEAALALAAAAGAPPAVGAERLLAVRRPLPPVPSTLEGERYVVLHPGASVPSRALRPDHAAELTTALVRSGRRVVLTGGPGERDLVLRVRQGALTTLGAKGSRRCGTAADAVVDFAGRTDLAGLAAVLEAADCAVVGNTGPAHLAAAVGTPVVSLFSPVVPALRWAPYGVPTVVLGDQHAACRDSRARQCPVPGHPCLSGVTPEEVVAAVDALGGPTAATATPLTGGHRCAS